MRLLGESGMGAVYEAEQDLPRRMVALKVIKPGWDSPEQLWRFEQESQALAPALGKPLTVCRLLALTADLVFCWKTWKG